MNREIGTLPARTGAVVTSTEFTRVHALAMKESALDAKAVTAGTWRQSGLYAAAPGG